MKRRIVTPVTLITIILLASISSVFAQKKSAWASDINVNPTPGREYKFARVSVAFNGTVYIGRVYRTSPVTPYNKWEVLTSTDNGQTFSLLQEENASSTEKYTCFDIMAAGTDSANFKLFVAAGVLDTVSGDAALPLYRYNITGATLVSTQSMNSNYTYTTQRGWESVSIASDWQVPNDIANPYCISVVGAKAGAKDSIVIWTDNVGYSNYTRRSLFGTPGYIRTVSVSIGTADAAESIYGRVAIAFDTFASSSAQWGGVKLKYVYPDDATDAVSVLPFDIAGDARHPSVALSAHPLLNDIITYVSFEQDGGSNGADINCRVDTNAITGTPVFSTTPNLGGAVSGDQIHPHTVYNINEMAFASTFYNQPNTALVFKGVNALSAINSNAVTANANYRDASGAMSAPWPRLAVEFDWNHYFVWNDGPDTYFDGQTIWPASLQQTSLAVKDITLYPNPATDNINISFTSDENDNATLTILDISGRVLQNTSAEIVKGANTVPVMLSGLSAGNYTLRISGAHVNTAAMFTVTR